MGVGVEKFFFGLCERIIFIMLTTVLFFITTFCKLNIGQTTINLKFTVSSDVIINRIPEMYFGFTIDWWKPTDAQCYFL